jgi:hypothetical protein
MFFKNEMKSLARKEAHHIFSEKEPCLVKYVCDVGLELDCLIISHFREIVRPSRTCTLEIEEVTMKIASVRNCRSPSSRAVKN